MFAHPPDPDARLPDGDQVHFTVSGGVFIAPADGGSLTPIVEPITDQAYAVTVIERVRVLLGVH